MKTAIAALLITLAAVLFGGANLAHAEAVRPVPVTPVATSDPGQLALYGLYGAGTGAFFGGTTGFLVGGIGGCLIGTIACPVTAPIGAVVGLGVGAAVGGTLGAIAAVHEAQTYQP